MSLTSNSGFLGQVKNIAGPLNNISSSEGKFNKLEAAAVSATSVATSALGVTEATLVGFAPPAYSTLGVGSALTLVNAVGYSPTGAGDTHLLQIPAGSVIKSIIVDNNGVTNTSGGVATIDVGLGAYNTAPTVDALVTGDILNKPILLAGPGYAAAPVGSTGGVPVAIVPAAPGNFVNVEVNTAALTAGELRATVQYCTLAAQ